MKYLHPVKGSVLRYAKITVNWHLRRETTH